MVNLREYRKQEREQARILDLMALVPKGYQSVLDIGARDGYISEKLTAYFTHVTALDLEQPQIHHERITPLKGDVTQLAFLDRMFDVVVCVEVLEHIPPPLLQRACNEISRVAKSAIIIGVPYRQDLRVGRTTCVSCGQINPPWGHVNTFTEKRLQQLFASLTLVQQTFVGATKVRTNWASTVLMDLAGNPWGAYDQEECCIYCGQNLIPPPPRQWWQRICARMSFGLRTVQGYFVASQPNWIHLLFQKS